MNRESKPILSICIPTYNRAPFLRQAVQSVLDQVDEKNEDKLELVVSDNASCDDTCEIMRQIQSQSLIPIIYHRNESNLGNDLNFIKVVEIASGRYCWLLGDDDQIIPGAINKILNEIKENPKVDIFLGNRLDYDRTLCHQFRYVPTLKIIEAREFDFNKVGVNYYLSLVRKLTGIFSYISSLVFNREKWLSISDKEKFVGTENVHVYIFMAMIWGRKKGVLKYIPDKIVKTRWGNICLPQKEDIYERSLNEVKCFRAFAQEIFWDDWRTIRQIENLVLKNDGFSWAVRAKIVGGPKFFAKVALFYLHNYWSYPLFWLKIFPLFFIPSILLKIMRWTYRKFVKQEPVGFREILEG